MRIAIDWAKRGKELAILVAIGTFLAIVNPFGATSSQPFWVSWMYWTGLVIYGSVVGSVCATLILKWMDGVPVLIPLAIIALVCALFVTPVLIVLHHAMGGHVPLSEYPMVYFLALVISIGMTSVGYLLDRAALVGISDPPVNEGEGLSGSEDTIRTFMSRLPLPYRNAELFAISSEDHYLRVHTSAGEHLFLERLSTAVHALNGARGLQTHRSWWVAEAGVEQTKSANGRIVLILKSGAEAPVSRTYAPAVKEAGWV